MVRAGRARDALDAPWLLALVGVASLGCMFAIESWRFGGAATSPELWWLVFLGYLISDTSSDPVNAAMRLIESLLLFRAVATAARSSGLRIATRLVGSLRGVGGRRPQPAALEESGAFVAAFGPLCGCS